MTSTVFYVNETPLFKANVGSTVHTQDIKPNFSLIPFNMCVASCAM